MRVAGSHVGAFILGAILASASAYAIQTTLSAGGQMELESNTSSDAFRVDNGVLRFRITWDGQVIVNSLRSPGANGSMRVVCVDNNGQLYRSNRNDRCS